MSVPVGRSGSPLGFPVCDLDDSFLNVIDTLPKVEALPSLKGRVSPGTTGPLCGSKKAKTTWVPYPKGKGKAAGQERAKRKGKGVHPTWLPYLQGKEIVAAPEWVNSKVKGPKTVADHAVAGEWHPDNEKVAADFTQGSGKKVWWQCSKGHQWEAAIASRCRVKKGRSNCPQCRVKKSR